MFSSAALDSRTPRHLRHVMMRSGLAQSEIIAHLVKQQQQQQGSGAEGSSEIDIESLIERLGMPQDNIVDHLPVFDTDGDYYSTYPGLRGSHWRGKDCADSDATVYPGRKVTAQPASVDHNCNGIAGTSPNGQSYEDLLCSGTVQRGLVNLGDSVTAHFRLPPDYLHPDVITNTTYVNLISVLEDEADWPQCSWGTGYDADANCPPAMMGKHVDSLMLRLRERNLCNHRDFQNIGVNGARTGAMAPPGIVNAMHQRNGTDHPALVVYALVGNDVCNGHHTFDTMTTPAEFETNVLNALAYLDETLAPGSYVVFLGLVDGRVLYDTLADQQHPLGVTYSDFYDYLNCIESSPCWGWMNSNETVRDLTWTQHASVLNQVYPKIISENTFNNFQMAYVPPDFGEIISDWVKAGGQAKDLIEPTDGFHPSQTANELLAEYLWNYLVANVTDAIGDVNPNNAQITQLFGDQGGF